MWDPRHTASGTFPKQGTVPRLSCTWLCSWRGTTLGPSSAETKLILLPDSLSTEGQNKAGTAPGCNQLCTLQWPPMLLLLKLLLSLLFLTTPHTGLAWSMPRCSLPWTLATISSSLTLFRTKPWHWLFLLYMRMAPQDLNCSCNMSSHKSSFLILQREKSIKSKSIF